MHVYDKICSVEVNSEETKKPMHDIKFTKVYMTTYGEIKSSLSSSDSSSDSVADSSEESSESK